MLLEVLLVFGANAVLPFKRSAAREPFEVQAGAADERFRGVGVGFGAAVSYRGGERPAGGPILQHHARLAVEDRLGADERRIVEGVAVERIVVAAERSLEAAD